MLKKLIKLRKSLKLSRKDISKGANIPFDKYQRAETQTKSKVSGIIYTLTAFEADRLYKFLINEGERQGVNFQELENINIINLLTDET